MKISTRGRYAIRVLVDLAEHRSGEYVPLKEIAERQEISQKYLESIMTQLSKSGLVDGAHGKGGGYRLNREPSDYTLGMILRVTEGELAPVSCLEEGANCARASDCRTVSVWRGLYGLINDYFDGISIADLMQSGDVGNYVI